MSMNRPSLLWPGPARLTLVLLAVIPAAMAYPWPSTRDRWLLGIAVAVAIVLLGWWRGLHFTTMLRRRLAMLGGNRAKGSPTEPTERTTAVLAITAVEGGDASLPLPLIVDFLDRYGIRADSIQITSCDGGSSTVPRETWVGLTVCAADNLPALQARASSIPLRETARVAARRLADQLREAGWEASVLQPEEVPQPIESKSRETWRAVIGQGGDHLAAYRISVDAALPETLRDVWLQKAQEVWTTVQITGTAADPVVAAACAFRTAERPQAAAPVAGLTPQRGVHRGVLRAIDPLSGDRLDGCTELDPAALAALRWPLQRPARPRARETKVKARHAAG